MCLQYKFEIPLMSLADDARRRFFHPLKSFLFSIKEWRLVSKSGRGIAGLVFLRPRTNSHSPGRVVECRRYPYFGAEVPGGTIVTFAPLLIQGRCGGFVGSIGMSLGVLFGFDSEISEVMASMMSLFSS